jgi:hypothetical protein
MLLLLLLLVACVGKAVSGDSCTAIYILVDEEVGMARSVRTPRTVLCILSLCAGMKETVGMKSIQGPSHDRAGFRISGINMGEIVEHVEREKGEETHY